MSKRVKNRKGKRGRGVRNTQYCKERGMWLYRRMQSKPEVKPVIEGFF